jgi:diphthine-ammonia ligase
MKGKEKAIVLFSGGKDAMFSLMEASENYQIVGVCPIINPEGNAQLTDGIETNEALIRAIVEMLGLPYEPIVVFDGDRYIHELAACVREKLSQLSAEVVVTGDLGHSNGVDVILKQRFDIRTESGASRSFLKNGADGYVLELVEHGISAVIAGVRIGCLPARLVGKRFDRESISEISELGIDITGEDGEFQTLVCDSPILKKRLVIDEYKTEIVSGRDGKGYRYVRMSDISFHFESKGPSFGV